MLHRIATEAAWRPFDYLETLEEAVYRLKWAMATYRAQGRGGDVQAASIGDILGDAQRAANAAMMIALHYGSDSTRPAPRRAPDTGTVSGHLLSPATPDGSSSGLVGGLRTGVFPEVKP